VFIITFIEHVLLKTDLPVNMLQNTICI